MVEIERNEITYIAFLECVFRGLWMTTAEEKEGITSIHSDDYNEHSAMEDGAEVWIVMPDRLRRAFSFEHGTTVIVYGSTIRFDQKDVIEEIAVDEEKQSGKK